MIAAKKKLTSEMPYGYRKKIVQILSEQGIELNENGVSNLLRGHVKSPENLEKIIAAMKTIKKEHAVNQRRLHKAQTAVKLFF